MGKEPEFCAGCEEPKIIIAKRLCNACYLRRARELHPEKHTPTYRRSRQQIAKCATCGNDKRIVGRGMCNACYCKWRYWNDPEKSRAYASAHYHLHGEERRAKKREDNKNNQQRIDYAYEYRRTPEFRQRSRERHAKHIQDPKYKAMRAAVLTNPNNRYSGGRKMANKRGLNWAISLEEYKEIIKNPCTYCETPLIDQKGHSLDRIDNDRGYELSNVLPCCGPCNRIRNNYLTVEEMRVAMKAVLELRKAKTSKSTDPEVI